MWLPSQDQIKNTTGNMAAAAGGAILVLGLSTKVDPAAITAIIDATGALAGNAVLLAGLLIPVVTAINAWISKSAKSQAVSLTNSQPGTVVVTTAAIAAATPNSPNVVSADDHVVVKK